MSNNIFSRKRFALLAKQHFIHNTRLLLLSVVAYVGVIFIVLSIVQAGNGLEPHNLENFQGFLIAFVSVFGILYAGHAFPALRGKESTINYLMVPASVQEKFVFEFLNRIAVTVLVLPVLYWLTFHMQGYSFNIVATDAFQPVSMRYLVRIDVPEDYTLVLYTMIVTGSLLALVLAFTGATMFTKQPLVKSLFALAVLVIFFAGYGYVVVEVLGIGRYNPPDNMYLVPRTEKAILTAITLAFIVANIVMLIVAFRKLKEREV